MKTLCYENCVVSLHTPQVIVMRLEIIAYVFDKDHLKTVKSTSNKELYRNIGKSS